MQHRDKKTILASTACIIAGVTFFAGLMLGSLISMGSSVPTARFNQQSGQSAPTGDTHSPEFDDHIATLRAEIARNPDESLNWIHLGNLYFDNAHPQEAIEAYEKALAISPNNPDVLTDLGTMYRETGNGTKAVELYDQAISLNPKHQNSRYNKGLTTMIELADPDAALLAWRELLAAIPDAVVGDNVPLNTVLADILTNGGTYLEDAGKNDAALRAYDLAQQENPNFAPSLAHKAALLEKLNRATEAYSVWQNLLKLQPDALSPDGRKVADIVGSR